MTRRRSLPVHGLGKALFCHATPRDDEEVVLVDSRLDRWREVLSGLDTDIRTVVCGHTHMPFVRLAHGRLVINPGSIGMPYGRAGAHWALLGPGRRTTLHSLRHRGSNHPGHPGLSKDCSPSRGIAARRPSEQPAYPSRQGNTDIKSRTALS
jgi:hypothetical protein